MKWVYKVFILDHFLNLDEDLSIEQKLNKYGKDGWELVGLLQKQPSTLGKPLKLNSDLIVFKNAVKE